jgi:hypothetical protein
MLPSEAETSRAYAFEGEWLVAPSGWSCTGGSGSGGTSVTASAGGEGWTEEIELYEASGGNHNLYLACEAFQSANETSVKEGLGSCKQVSVRPGGRIERTANLVKVIEPGPESTLTYIWWFAKSDSAARLTCTATNKPLGFCAAAFKDFDRRIREWDRCIRTRPASRAYQRCKVDPGSTASADPPPATTESSESPANPLYEATVRESGMSEAELEAFFQRAVEDGRSFARTHGEYAGALAACSDLVNSLANRELALSILQGNVVLSHLRAMRPERQVLALGALAQVAAQGCTYGVGAELSGR